MDAARSHKKRVVFTRVCEFFTATAALFILRALLARVIFLQQRHFLPPSERVAHRVNPFQYRWQQLSCLLEFHSALRSTRAPRTSPFAPSSQHYEQQHCALHAPAKYPKYTSIICPPIKKWMLKRMSLETPFWLCLLFKYIVCKFVLFSVEYRNLSF